MANLPNRVHDALLNRWYVFDGNRWRIEDSVTGRPSNFVSEPTVQAAYAAAAARAAATPAPTPRPTVVPTPAPAPAPAAAAQPVITPAPATPAQPAARPQAAQVTPAATPQTASTPQPGVVQAPQENTMYRNLAIAATVVIAFLVGALFFTTRSGDNSAGKYDRTDIAGVVSAETKDLREKVGKLDTRTTTMSDTIATLDTKVGKIKSDVETGFVKMMETLQEIKAGKTTPTPSAPANPAMSALEQQRRATVSTECLPEDQKNLNLGDSLDQGSFDALIAHCKANKLATQRMVSPPPAAGRPQVAQNDQQDEPEADEDQDAQAPGQARAQPVGYGGAQPAYGRGQRQGGRRCEPGTRPAGNFGCVGATITNRAETRIFDTNIRSGCVQGATQTIWKEGVDQQGRRVRYKIDQHTECRGQRRQ